MATWTIWVAALPNLLYRPGWQQTSFFRELCVGAREVVPFNSFRCATKVRCFSGGGVFNSLTTSCFVVEAAVLLFSRRGVSLHHARYSNWGPTVKTVGVGACVSFDAFPRRNQEYPFVTGVGGLFRHVR